MGIYTIEEEKEEEVNCSDGEQLLNLSSSFRKVIFVQKSSKCCFICNPKLLPMNSFVEHINN